MKRLGAIIAGGQSRRFGGDKRGALLNGRPLIEHVIAEMQQQTDSVVVVGKPWGNFPFVADYKAPDMGPLFGLCAALRYAKDQGFASVFTAGCDTLPVPPLIVETLGEPPSVIEGQWLFGHWPATLADDLAHHLEREDDHSMRHWIAVSGARQTDCKISFSNVNTPLDLGQFNLADDGPTP